MLFEIKNPSDPYTIEGEFLDCALAVTLVGAGRMALSPLREVQGDEAREKYLNDWENDRQSSLVPIGANYRKSAESLRRKFNLPRVWPADLIEAFVSRAAGSAVSA